MIVIALLMPKHFGEGKNVEWVSRLVVTAVESLSRLQGNWLNRYTVEGLSRFVVKSTTHPLNCSSATHQLDLSLTKITDVTVQPFDQ